MPWNFNHKRSFNRGSVLLLVLITVALMSLITGSYLALMRNEHTATRYDGRRQQARLVVESGVEYLLAILNQSDEEIKQQGGLANNPTRMQSILVVDDPMPAFQGRFTVLANKINRGYYEGLRYGLENESAKLNLNTLVEDDREGSAARKRLLAVPGIDSSLADAILDWLDQDDLPREFGAEQSHYQDLSPAYQPRNGPLAALDELLSVRGVTPELLYGLDSNRSYLVEMQEQQARGVLNQLDNDDGELNRGLSAYLTVHSLERLENPEGKEKVHVNLQDMGQLYELLVKVIGEEEAKFIVAYRQNGPATLEATGQSLGLSALELDWEKKAKTKIASLLDLVGARVSVQIKKESPPQILQSPWQDDPATYRDSFLNVLKFVQVVETQRIAGRINLNEASRPVLMSIPGMTQIVVDQILSQRDSTAQHPLWILIERIVTLEEMKQIAPYVTGGGDAYSAQIVGYFETMPRARAEVILDRSEKPSQVVRWQDLSHLGPGAARSVLDEEDSEGGSNE